MGRPLQRSPRSGVVNLALSCIAAPSLVAPAFAAEAADATEPLSTEEVSPNVIIVPLVVDGRYVGDISALLTADGRAAVRIDRLISLLNGIASPRTIDRVKQAAGDAAYLRVDYLGGSGLDARYDSERLEIRLDLAASDRSERQISLTGRDNPRTVDYVKPSYIAAGVTFGLTQDYVHKSDTQPVGAAPLRGGVRGGANFGGPRGLNLAFEAFYDAALEEEWQRGDTALYWDHEPSATRVSAGDINPIGMGLQSSPGLGGLGVQTLYQVITPVQNIRPTGRTRFLLDRPSVVEILVNGGLYQTIRLEPGAYDLRDFPFVDGLNDVRVLVRDETGGLREVANFSQFMSYELLDDRVSEFEFIVGYPTVVGPTGNEYEATPAMTAFFRRGIGANLTLGAHLQGSDDRAMGGATAVVATRFGVFSAEADGSIAEGVHTGYAGSFGWDWTSMGELGPTNVGVFLEGATVEFTPLDGITTRLHDYDYQAAAFARKALRGGLNIGAAASYAPGRGDTADETRINASVARPFGRFLGALFVEWSEIGADDELRLLATFTYRLGTRQRLRARYDTDDNRYQLAWERLGQTSVGAWGARIGLEGDENTSGAVGHFDYVGNRMAGTLTHHYVEEYPQGGLRDQVTTAEVEFGVGFAGGRVAVGRAADRGFTIVDRHRSLRDKRVDVGSRGVSGGAAARADWLGPALVPTTSVYLPTDVTFDVDDLPDGYSLGEGRAALRPAAFSGYRLTVGSSAANTVFGVMHASDEALSLRGGWLAPLDGQAGGRVAFFTNRKGRFIAEGVSHGRYAVVMAGETEPVAEIRIPKDQVGLIDVGAVDIGG